MSSRTAPLQLLCNTAPRTSCCNHCVHNLQRHSFSSSRIRSTKLRDDMFRWYNGPGSNFKHPLPSSTNYLGAYNTRGGIIRADGRPRSEFEEGKDTGSSARSKPSLPAETPDDLQPFPMNRAFRSQAVLSEELKDEIFKRVMIDGQDVRKVSASLNVEMRRVAAVVRLKAVESQWVKDGKQLALPYAKATMSMLPQTPYVPGSIVDHEPINDLNVHQHTMHQVFAPASESRQFNRDDAAKAFDRRLLSADKRIPHPEMIQQHKWRQEGYHREEIQKLSDQQAAEEAKRKAEREERQRRKEAMTVKRRETDRWEFKFRDISVQSVGKDGRSPAGVGHRYGMPLEDRKKGVQKLPTRVP